MSLPGIGRSEYGPERIDLTLQFRHAAAVVQDHISRNPAIFPSGLSGNPRLGLGSTEAVARYQSLDLGFMINIDCHDKIEIPLLAGLDQQGNDMDNNCSRTSGLLQFQGSRPDGRMHDPLQISARDRISKDDFGKACSIEPAVDEQLGAESIENCRQARSSWLDDLPGEHVCIDDDRTACRQLVRNQAFARRDAAGKADPYFVDCLARSARSARIALQCRCLPRSLAAGNHAWHA
jgi:hypothetical protein